jgi:hypothetical protein
VVATPSPTAGSRDAGIALATGLIVAVVIVVVGLARRLASPTTHWRNEARLVDTDTDTDTDTDADTVPWRRRTALDWSGLCDAAPLAAALG